MVIASVWPIGVPFAVGSLLPDEQTLVGSCHYALSSSGDGATQEIEFSELIAYIIRYVGSDLSQNMEWSISNALPQLCLYHFIRQELALLETN